jgi:hypothetical protein
MGNRSRESSRTIVPGTLRTHCTASHVSQGNSPRKCTNEARGEDPSNSELTAFNGRAMAIRIRPLVTLNSELVLLVMGCHMRLVIKVLPLPRLRILWCTAEGLA